MRQIEALEPFTTAAETLEVKDVREDAQKPQFIQRVPISREIERIRRCLETHGYALTCDTALEFASDFHRRIDQRFFTPDSLGPEVPGMVPCDRMLARDVIEYRRSDAGVALAEHPSITLPPRVNADAPREYRRSYVLDDRPFAAWIGAYLQIIPPEEQLASGTIAVNFVRTFHDVVAYKHQDNDQFVLIYVCDRQADGAVTSLYPIGNPDQTEFAAALMPGEMLVFRDRDFLHDATPIQPRFQGDAPHRDAVLLTISYPVTYDKSYAAERQTTHNGY